jgi:hypothetical protein
VAEVDGVELMEVPVVEVIVFVVAPEVDGLELTELSVVEVFVFEVTPDTAVLGNVEAIKIVEDS